MTQDDRERLLEGQTFEEIWNNQAKTYQEFLENIEDPEKRDKFERYHKRSEFIVGEARERLGDLFDYQTKLLVISTDWCWDSQFYLPIIAHIAEASDKVEVRILLKEKNIDLLKKTNGGQKVPYVLIYSQDGYHIDTWVERPAGVYVLVAKLRQQFGFSSETKDEYYKEYKKLFLKDAKHFNLEAMNELVDRIIKANAIQGTSPRINASR